MFQISEHFVCQSFLIYLTESEDKVRKTKQYKYEDVIFLIWNIIFGKTFNSDHML